MNNRVLVTIQWFTPGYRAGGPVASVAGLVKHLQEEYDFYVLTSDRDYGETVPYEEIEPGKWMGLEPHLHVCYLSPGQQHRGFMEQRIREAGCDRWLITGMYSRAFSILPLRIARRLNPGMLIVSPRGMLSSHALSVKSWKKKPYLALTRLAGWYREVIFHATGTEEVEAIRRFAGPAARIRMAPNLPAPPLPNEVRRPLKKPGSLELVSVARISPEKNTLGALRILSSIDTGTSIRFTLAGQAGSRRYWRQCREIIDRMPAHIRVEHTGALPPGRLKDLIGRSHFLFLPTLGENYGHAIIECLAAGLPVLISDRTPWNRLVEGGGGWTVPPEDETRFVRILEACVAMDNESYRIRSEAARTLAAGVISDPEIMEKNCNLFRNE